MRFLLSSSLIILFIGLSFLEGGLTSCTKDKTIYDTVTVVERDTLTVTDTLIIKDTAVTEAILTANPWKAQEMIGVLEGTVIKYIRGGSGNTNNYDNDYVVFNADKTGTGVDALGVSHNISHWDFANTAKTKITFTYFNTPSISTVVTWDNLRFKNNALYYDAYYSDNNTGNDYHGQEVRIPQ